MDGRMHEKRGKQGRLARFADRCHEEHAAALAQ